MPRYTTETVRNIALVGHAAAGKTCLTEHLLYKAGAINVLGAVEKGNTVSDYELQEQRHQHSLCASFVSLDHGDIHVNLIDTPGYPDFLGQTLSVLPAVETVAVVINAQTGIEAMTRRMMDWAAKRGLCRMIIVNKIDIEGVDLEGLLNEIRDTFGSECLAINLPAQAAAEVVDCFFNPAGESDFWSVEQAHTALVDQVVEVDEQLMALYLEQGTINPEQLHDPFEQALREGHLVPVCFASARTGAGVDAVLQVFERLMPNPAEGNPPPFLKGEGAAAVEVHSDPDPAKHVLAHVVKVVHDPFVGKIGVFRIHQGIINRDSKLLIGDARKPFKVGHLLKLHGKRSEEIDAGIPGDICAVSKVEEIHIDAVLHDSHEEDEFHLRPVRFPTPMYGLAVQAASRIDEQKISEALHKLAAEDPCFVVEHTSTNNETVIRGLGELHLRVMLEKMSERFNVQVETHPPSIPYRETISGNAEGHYRHKKQSGGAGQFGEVFLRIESLAQGSGFEFRNAVVGGAIPGTFIPAVEKGVRQLMEAGAIAGYPLQDIAVTVYDGKYHPVDSNEVSFVIAGRKALLDAVLKCNPQVLEPFVELEVTAPAANVGDITGDLASRRGRVTRTDTRSGGSMLVAGQAPLAELTDYQTRLKSLTGGAGSYSMQFSHYEPAPPQIQQQLASQFKRAAD